MSPQQTSALRLIETSLDSLRPFPQIVLDIISVLDDDDAKVTCLVDHLHRDVVLSAKVLGLANAASNRLPGQRSVTDVNSAVSMLGFSRIRTLVTTLSLRDALTPEAPLTAADQFWGHSVDVATAAKVIAEHTDLKPEIAYVAGLLHDIGVLWIASQKPQEFNLIMSALSGTTHALIDTEREVLGTDHAELGAALCDAWNLPAHIRMPVAGHHDPDSLSANPYVMAVHLAEMTCNALDLGKRQRNLVANLSEQALPQLGLNWTQVPHLLGEIEARARFMRAFAGIKAN